MARSLGPPDIVGSIDYAKTSGVNEVPYRPEAQGNLPGVGACRPNYTPQAFAPSQPAWTRSQTEPGQSPLIERPKMRMHLVSDSYCGQPRPL